MQFKVIHMVVVFGMMALQVIFLVIHGRLLPSMAVVCSLPLLRDLICFFEHGETIPKLEKKHTYQEIWKDTKKKQQQKK